MIRIPAAGETLLKNVIGLCEVSSMYAITKSPLWSTALDTDFHLFGKELEGRKDAGWCYRVYSCNIKSVDRCDLLSRCLR